MESKRCPNVPDFAPRSRTETLRIRSVLSTTGRFFKAWRLDEVSKPGFISQPPNKTFQTLPQRRHGFALSMKCQQINYGEPKNHSAESYSSSRCSPSQVRARYSQHMCLGWVSLASRNPPTAPADCHESGTIEVSKDVCNYSGFGVDME